MNETENATGQVRKNKHGMRADGVTTVTIPMPRALKSQLVQLAKQDHRQLAPWMRLHLQALVRRSTAARRAAT